jgi:hypothetical protein
VAEAITTWNKLHLHSNFWLLGGEHDELVLLDTRGTRERAARLTGWKAEIYAACDRPRSRQELEQIKMIRIHQSVDVDRFLQRCTATGAMLAVGDTYLSLAVRRPARTTSDPSTIRHIPVTSTS